MPNWISSYLQDYKEHLDELVDKKVISGYKNASTIDQVNFDISDYQGLDLIKDLKLRKSFRTSNMHLFHTSGIKKYESAEEILGDFFEIRLEYYKKRKVHLIKVLSEKTLVLESKARFIKLVISGELVIFKRKQADVEADLVKLKFDSFEYLWNLKTSQYTEEAIRDLNKLAETCRKELTDLKKTTVVNMWTGDLKLYTS